MGIKAGARHVAKEIIGPRVLPRLPRRVDPPLDTFGLRVGPGGGLHLGEHDLADLAARYGSPLHVVDGRRLDDAADAAMEPVRDGRGCDIFYSYKTNPVPAVLRRLHAAGIGAEVISAYELWLALELGVPGDRIIYNGPAKSAESIRVAIEHDVLAINANSTGDLRQIAAIAADTGRTANVGIRVALLGGWGGQFGITADLDTVTEIVENARQDPNVELTSVHVHRGSTIRTRDEVIDHVGQLLTFLDDVHERTGWSPEIVDFGGSLACATVAKFDNRNYRLNRLLGADLLPPDPAMTATVAEASRRTAAMVSDWAERRDVPVPTAVLEPGRALTAGTQLLITTVHDVKDDVEPVHAVIDAGINIAETASNEYHQLYSVMSPTAPATTPYRLAGPICTPADVLYNSWRLPELAPGHLLAIMDTGAYFVPFSTSFSFPRPAIVVCEESGEVGVMRRAETFDDIVRLDGPTAGPPP